MISRPIKEGFSGVGRHWGMSISSMVAVTITLIIISFFTIFSWNVRKFTQDIESSMEISVMVDFDHESEEDQIKQKIEAIDGVVSVTFQNKDQEFQYYLDSLNDDATREAFESFRDDNPMHDAFYVEVAEGREIKPIADEIQKIDGVAENGVNFGGQSTINMVNAMNTVRKVGAIFAIGLTLLAVFLIANTIKLTINARQDEIRIMRNVGATNHFIRSPFVIEGMIIGFLGSIIPIALTVWGYFTLYQRTGGSVISKMFVLEQPIPFIGYVSLLLVILGILVGLIGSWLSVTRYLRWKR